MPSGAKKRKAAKKKKVHDSSTTNPHHGENDQSAEKEVVEVEKREDNSSENKSKDVGEAEEGKFEIEIGSKSKSSHSSSSSSSDSSDDESSLVEKQVVVLESVPVIESSPDNKSPIVDPVKPVEISKVYDETKNEERQDLVVEEQAVVVSEIGLNDECQTSSVVVESVPKENGPVELLPLVDGKASLESKDHVASSTSANGSISEVNGADCSNETHTVEHSDRQSPAASIPLAAQKTTSWKSCCGIFDLFSGTERN